MAAICANPTSNPPKIDQLPSGPCNYRDLASGPQAPICGCRRFWAREPQDYGAIERRAWCFCGHHACFHDAFTSSAYAMGSISSRVEHNGESQLRLPDDKGRPTDAIQQHPTIPELRHSSTRQSTIAGGGKGLGLSDRNIFNALNAFVRGQASSASGSEINLPSTAAASITESQGVTSSHAFMQHVLAQSRPMGPPLRAGGRNGTDFVNEANSATEVNTPSIRGSPRVLPPRACTELNLDKSSPSKHDAPRSRQAPISGSSLAVNGNASQHSQNIQSANAVSDTYMSPLELRDIVNGCVQRLNMLESLSYSHVPVEEIEDKFELIDGRLLDLEHWRIEEQGHQRELQENGGRAAKRRRPLPDEITTSFNSDVSLGSKSSLPSSSSALSATAAVYAEYNGRFDGLEQRLDMLEQNLPSFARPWQVQVVMLPWGRDLRGIWNSFERENSDAASKDEEWNGTSASLRSTFGISVGDSHGWTTDSIMAWADTASEWLCPKACGPNGVVYKRLQSRGLVQNVLITSLDARGILQSCRRAFAHFLDEHARLYMSESTETALQALKEAIVPLRKVRKSSRLRFLHESEMMTSATWTAAMLDASVLMKMKPGHRRLYLTTPDAYLQTSYQGWDWKTLKALAEPKSTHDGPVDAKIEACTEDKLCWAHHPHLDAGSSAASLSNSHSTRQSQWSTTSQASQRLSKPLEEMDTVKPPVSPISDKRTARETMTVALPMAAIDDVDITSVKRRTASFEPASSGSKRRRTSAGSDNNPLRTPRWSREPPSPFTSENPGDSRSQGANSATRRRGNTPFAYATPHSNTVTAAPIDSGEGDTEADTEILPHNSIRGDGVEEEWQGVADDDIPGDDNRSTKEIERTYSDSESGDDEVDLDEGLTIYGG